MKHLRKNPTLNLKLILDIQDMPIFETTIQNTRSKKTKTITARQMINYSTSDDQLQHVRLSDYSTADDQLQHSG